MTCFLLMHYLTTTVPPNVKNTKNSLPTKSVIHQFVYKCQYLVQCVAIQLSFQL
jgi:hypothetical protein